jgi:hypothetical protein
MTKLSLKVRIFKIEMNKMIPLYFLLIIQHLVLQKILKTLKYKMLVNKIKVFHKSLQKATNQSHRFIVKKYKIKKIQLTFTNQIKLLNKMSLRLKIHLIG